MPEPELNTDAEGYAPPEVESPDYDLEDIPGEIEAELTEARDDRVSPLILSAAVIGMLIGFFVWGSLAVSVLSSAEGVLEDVGADTEGSPATGETSTDRLDCDAFGPQRVLPPELESAYQEQCVTPETTQATPPDPALNREDCDAIRGTDYRSQEERTWFLDNCVG